MSESFKKPYTPPFPVGGTMRVIGQPKNSPCPQKLIERLVFDKTGREVSNIIYCRVRKVESPNRAHMTDAGADFYVPEFDDEFLKEFVVQNPDCYQEIEVKDKVMTIPPHGSVKIPSGVRVFIVDNSTYLWLDDKSGVAGNKHLKLGANCVDCGFTGEIIFHLFNFSDKPAEITEGQKLVQGIQQHYIATNYKEVSVEEFSKIENTPRGSGMFGSTNDMKGS